MIEKITNSPNNMELIKKINETIEGVNKGGGSTPSSGVTSVNGKTGDVTITVPTNTNELTNGAGFITESALTPYAKSSTINSQLITVNSKISEKADKNELNPFVKSVTESENVITVTKGDGSTNTINLPTGTDGKDGADGFSPSVTVYKNTDDEFMLKITNKEGALISPNLNGFSPSIRVASNTESEFKLYITDKSGTSITPNLKGSKGDKGDSGTGGGGGVTPANYIVECSYGANWYEIYSNGTIKQGGTYRINTLSEKINFVRPFNRKPVFIQCTLVKAGSFGSYSCITPYVLGFLTTETKFQITIVGTEPDVEIDGSLDLVWEAVGE